MEVPVSRSSPVSMLLCCALGSLVPAAAVAADPPAAAPEPTPQPAPVQPAPVYPQGYPIYAYPPGYPAYPQPTAAPVPAPVAEPATASLPPMCKPLVFGTPKEVEKMMGEIYGTGRDQFAFFGNGLVCGWK